MKAVIQRLGIKFIYSGPYSYSAAPAELLFGGLKDGDINPENKATSKK